MVLWGCVLDMMLLRVFAIVYLELMALSLGLGILGSLKRLYAPLICKYLSSQRQYFISQLFMVLLGFALDVMLLWVSVIITLKLMALSIVLRGPS